MSEVKPIRLVAAAKKLNVGTDTVIDHLTSIGFEVENKPTTKLSAEMYEALLKEFRADLNIKEEAEQITLGGARREQIEIDQDKIAPPKKSEPVQEILIKNTGVGTDGLGKKKEKEKEKEEEKVVERPTVNLDGPKVIGTVDLEKPKKEEVKKEEVKEEKVEPKKPKKEEVQEDFLKTKKVELDGPKVIGRINLPVKEEKPKKEESSDSDRPKRKRKRIIKGRKIDTRNTPKGRVDKDGKKQAEEQISEKEIQEKIKSTMAKVAGASKGQTRAKIRRDKRQEINEKKQASAEEKQDNLLELTEFVSVSELANMMDISPTQVISTCMGLGVIVSINQRLDAEIIELVASEFDYEVKFISASEDDEFEIFIDQDSEDITERAPIVTIMGHVDHGKTSLLDYIRSANVASGEAGGITQHIGAYEVKTESGKKVAFLDTPGHEAFTAMRARGAKLTDVSIIVIAADDAIMPQTKEAISHSQSAGVPMIFAINKIDKDGADPEKIKGQLAEMNILVEDWGGKFQCQELSAKTGQNIDHLLEKILLEAEMLELKANPDSEAVGTIIEASLDKGRGYVATALVQNGTLEIGDMIVSGSFFGKVKAMYNHLGGEVTIAGPATPVQILGLNGAPQAGEKFKMFDSEQEAKSYAAKRGQIDRELGLRSQKHITLDEIGRRLALGTFKELNIIIKADVDGSVEAMADSLQKLSNEEIQVNILHRGVGQITETDVLLASASDAIVIGFQVRPSLNARKIADNENIEIRLYSVIYQAIDEIKSAMEGMLEPTIEEKIIANVEIREVFKITKVGTIAGCYVLDGKITRNAKVRIIREGIVVYTGELESLKRFKDDVKDVAAGFECGLNIKNFNDIKAGDIVEAYEEVEIQRSLDD